MALPTSSEETKRAKRENLEQKQILVPELCMVHVVPASLWRQAVCLPCILYRINALLLADQIRALVANQICLGLTNIPVGVYHFWTSPLKYFLFMYSVFSYFIDCDISYLNHCIFHWDKYLNKSYEILKKKVFHKTT